MSNLRESFKNAIRGLKLAFREEKNIKIHFAISSLILLLAIVLDIKKIEFIFVLVAIMAVIATEMLNTAIEKLLDMISPDYNSGVGKIKDIAAGSVFVCALIAAVIGLIIFTPYIYKILGR